MADASYSTFSTKMANAGVVARYTYDALPPNTYLSLNNLESREEGALSSRFGLSALTTDGSTQNFPLGAAVNSLSRMQGIGTPYRYATTTAGKLFRRAGNSVGAFSQIATGLSGGRVSMSPYRPANSSSPWQFVADASLLVKDNGTLGTAENWGIAPPVQPALIIPVESALLDIELFGEGSTSSFTLTNLGSSAMANRVQATITNSITAGVALATLATFQTSSISRTSNVSTATTTANHGFVTGMRVSVVPSSNADASFGVASAVITVTGVTTFTYANVGPNGSAGAAATVSPLPSFIAGMSVTTSTNAESVYVVEVTEIGFIATFANNHGANTVVTESYLTGTVAANTLATVSKANQLNISFATTQVAADQNFIQLFVLLSNPLAVKQIQFMFDVGDGTFTQDYYAKAVVMSTAQPLASGTIPASVTLSQGVSARAIGLVNFSSLGGDNPGLLPSDMPLLQQIQPTSLDPGANVWTLIQVPLSQFVANGAAGGPNNNWTNVVAWQVQIQTQATLTTTVGLDDLVFVGGSDLNSFAGQPYDYRYTYINLNTGCESNPSQTMVATDAETFTGHAHGHFQTTIAVPVPLSVQQQSIQVTAIASPDAQVTHWNLYRRGGTLTQAWYFVAQIPIGTLTYVDTIADSIIEINNQLQVDSDAPVTSLLPTPLKTTSTTASFGPKSTSFVLASGSAFLGQLLTIDTGPNQETVYVSGFSFGSPVAYFQFNHTTGCAVTATTRPQTPMNLSAIAFDQAFLAGDPNNPHILYYSRTFAPETFPSENFIEVGTPDAPIMALVVLRGSLYVFTTKTVWQIYGGQGSTPLAVPTGVMHGLVASWGWAASENVVYYVSYDGVYMFTGSGATYLTQNTEWIWTSRTETNGVIPVLSQAQKANTFMAYGNHEVFVAYIDGNGVTHRQIGSDTYQRWRNDDQAAGNITAMFFEQDTGMLVVGKDDGMVYLDRVNDYDDGGWVASVQVKNPIAINLQTPQLDLGVPKAFKVWNEFTLDATLPVGLVVTVTAKFDSLATTNVLGTITGTGGRVQYQLNVNAGLGYRSLNGGLLLTGNTTGQAIFHEVHVRAVMEAEERTSYDSYKLDFGSASWKMAKQAWFVYAGPDAAGVAMSVYLDDAATPIYTFTLPQTLPSSIRTTQKVRFPPMKFRIMRLVGTSASPFQMYDKDTEVETKALDSQKGYTKQALST